MRKPLARFVCGSTAIAVCSLIGCAAHKVKSERPLELDNVGSIELHIETSGSSLLASDLNKQVSDNLTGWHYPIEAQAGRRVSHKLTATVGAIEYTDTPTGFSFSAGNSDPRAMGFQKTEVLPIHCQLSAINHPEQSSDLSMGFTASPSDKKALNPNKLADHISTVCFNLLRDVKWPESAPAHASGNSQPSWMPEIRIEEVPEAAPIDAGTKGSSLADSVEKSNAARPSNTPLRKQITIHNQGSPVILHWGHERR